ncbi:MAG TPA: HEAT repeat domain-containing protein [Anaerolineae bacterium]|nr:HEAT repeat domain-containing protein [Anaerolineae bacterium]
MPCTAYSPMLHSPGPAPLPQHWQFDVGSALIGAAVALLLAGLAYRYRDALRQGWKAALAPLGQWQARLQASAEDRYRELVAIRARSLVIPAGAVSLDSIFIEPRLFPPAPVPESLSEIEPVPIGPRALPLHQTLGGHPRLVILGTPGAGRTTSLAYVALACARVARDGDSAARVPALGPVQERLPLCVPLPAMDWSEADGADEHERDGTERLLHAAVAAVGGSSGMARALRQRLEAGQAVVLADGWDELSPQQRGQAAAWLTGRVDALPGNLWLVGAGTRGYARLIDAGFVPLTLAAWDAGQVEAFARRWVEICTPAGESTPVVVRRLVAALQGAARAGAPPLELALRALVVHTDGEAPTRRAALFDRALDCLLWQEKEPWLSGVCRAILGQVTLSLQQEGRATVTRAEIDAAIETALPPSEERPARAVAHVFHALTGARGLLRPEGPGHYAPAHPLWQAYLAARQLAAVDPAELVEQLDDPCWAEVLRFYAELGDMGPLVAAWLHRPADMFHTHLHRLSSWIGVAPEDAGWRDGAMATLARAFLQPGLPGPVRQALAESLAATGAPGLTYFFKQATQHPDAGVRVAAALGLTRTVSEADLAALEAVIADESAAVRAAVVRRLAHLGIDAATRWLARIVMAGDETLSPIAGEALARCGEEGVTFLREAVESEDAMVRRAAVLGLAQVKARELLEKLAREDGQWIVRSAALAALDELDERESISGVAPPPEVEQLPWLISWAASQREGVEVGDAARRMLRRAMSAGDAPVRLAAAQTLAQVGRPDDVELLKTALSDDDPSVANAALEALAGISRRYDLRIE